jgi:PAS domain S-box-containing protein
VICAQLETADVPSQLARLCRKSSEGYFTPLKVETQQSIRENRRLSPHVFMQMMEVRDALNGMSAVAMNEVDSLFERTMDERQRALAILWISTLGFASAGLVLMLLIGHASMKHHAQIGVAKTAAADARQSLDLMRATMEALPAGVLLFDPDDRLMLFNAAAAAFSPILTHPDVIGMTYAEMIEADMRLGANSTVRWGAEDSAAWIARFNRKEEAMLLKVVGNRWFEFSERRTPTGHTVGLRTDVTALQVQKLEIASLHDQFEALVASLSDVVFSLDLKVGTLTFVSPSAQELFEVPLDKLKGARLIDFVSPQDTEQLLRVARQEYVAADRGVRQVRFRVKVTDGREKHVEARFRRMPGDDATAVAGVLRDVEVQTRLGEKLEAEWARLRSIVESAGALVLLVDRNLRIVTVNSAFAEFTGVDQDAAAGRPMREIVDWTIDAELLEGWHKGRWADMDIKTAQFIGRHIDREGRERVINLTAKPVLDRTGKFQQIVFVGVDDTARQEAEQALFATERLVAVGEMSAAVAHEIAQPLQVINLACHSALDELGEHADANAFDVSYVRQKLDRIAGQIERSNRIVGQLRDFVHGVSAQTPRPFDPADAIRTAAEVTSYAVREAGLQMSLSLGPPGPQLLGHIARLEQVVVNLINNARDSGGSMVKIMLSAERREDGADQVRITVKDDGPGIAAEVIDRLFNTIVTTKARGKGTGLGLRVCRRIVEEMGGTITGGNRAKGGARFEMVLPALAAQSRNQAS